MSNNLRLLICLILSLTGASVFITACNNNSTSPTPAPNPTLTPTITSTPTNTFTPTVTSTPTFCTTPSWHGHATPEASAYTSGYILANPVTLGSTTRVISISYYCVSNPGPVRTGLFADSSGKPGALLTQSAPQTTTTIGTWYTVSVPPVDLVPGVYWIASCATAGTVGENNTASSQTYGLLPQPTFGPYPTPAPTPAWIMGTGFLWSQYLNTCP